MKIRKIIHIDMDAFFASVEQRDNPALRKWPLVVGGDPDGRGVVASCCYAARAFGIHSAMSCARARRLCPQAIFVRPRRERYKEISARIRTIFRRYATAIEPLSIDEAFLDVTDNPKQPSATWTAEAIRRDILSATGLTASAGVSCNKFLAKVASDMNKPNGITVIPPEKALDCILGLPVRRFYGVGRVTEKRMKSMNIHTGADLVPFSREELVARFGKAGNFYYDIVRGIDNRPVRPRQGRKSIGTESTFAHDLTDPAAMRTILVQQAGQICANLARKQMAARTLTLKVRYPDFVTVTRSHTPRVPILGPEDIAPHLGRLLGATRANHRGVRLLGLSLAGLVPCHDLPRQLHLPWETSGAGSTVPCPDCCHVQPDFR
jgi:DNA polymerase-4